MKEELDALGATIYGISVDSQEHAQEVADMGLTFPMAYGATKEDSDLMGAWGCLFVLSQTHVERERR